MSKVNISVGMIIFNGNYVLKECLESIYPFVNQILVAEGPVRYWQSKGFTKSTDGTIEVLHDFPDPQNKIKIIHSQYKEKDEQCNAYMKHLDYKNDFLWNLDCDEIFKPEDIEKLIKLMENLYVTSVGFKSSTFYGGFTDRLTGFERDHQFMRIRRILPGSTWSTHRPPTIQHANGQKYLYENHLDYNTLSAIHGIEMYHYSYVFPKQVKEKVAYYESDVICKGGCIPFYYDNVYRPWTEARIKHDYPSMLSIENQYEGVHEFIVQNRGKCRTELFFEKDHPLIIQKRIPEFEKIIETQLELL